MKTRNGDDLFIIAGVSLTITLAKGKPADVKRQMDYLVEKGSKVGLILGCYYAILMSELQTKIRQFCYFCQGLVYKKGTVGEFNKGLERERDWLFGKMKAQSSTKMEFFEVKHLDKRIYTERIRDFLPEKVIDIHAHIWLKENNAGPDHENRVVRWASSVAEENPVEDLLETYRLLLPGKSVTPLVFNMPTKGKNLDTLNRYVSESAKKYKLPPLMLSRPEWPAEEFSERLQGEGFLGVKPYLSYAPSHIPAKEIRIFDFIPRHQLEVLNRQGKILLLHIPRDGRLKDPVNLAQMLEIEERYPDIKLIIAHVGRAYCSEDIGDAFKILAGTQKMFFDISANTNETVFRQLIETMGPERILFGSDLPITRMRMRRICEKGIYINLVPEGLYGDVSDDKNMRAVQGEEAEKLTFFFYEEIMAFLEASKTIGLNKNDLKKVFFTNATFILQNAGFGN